MIKYQVSVLTGDRRGAGTSAKVHLVIYGTNGDTGERALEPAKGFERASTESFGIEVSLY